MDGITSFVSRIVDTVNTFLWDYALLFLLVGAGIFFTLMLGLSRCGNSGRE